MRIHELLEEVSAIELLDIEKFANALWNRLGINVKFTTHFLSRVNDERNKKPITKSELKRVLEKEFADHGYEIADMRAETEAIMKDVITDVNLPFVMKDIKNTKTLAIKTVVRKKKFNSPNLVYLI